jgi:hypothetical protein
MSSWLISLTRGKETYKAKNVIVPSSELTSANRTTMLSIDRMSVYHIRRCRRKTVNDSGGCSRTMACSQPNVLSLRRRLFVIDHPSVFEIDVTRSVCLIIGRTYIIRKPEILSDAVGIPRNRIFDRPVDQDPRSVHPAQHRPAQRPRRELEPAKVLGNAHHLGGRQERVLPVIAAIVEDRSLSEKNTF